MSDVDVLVIGGGPAGAATAIACRQAGLRTTLVERCAFPRPAPGETLHPGVLPLLRRLGVEEPVLAAGFLRHAGHFVRWDGPEQFVPFGQDAGGPWLGVQAWRPEFDALLLGRARQLGVMVLQPCPVVRPVVAGRRVAGVDTSHGVLGAAYVVDATGRRRWLSQQLGLGTEEHGPRRVVWFGYAKGDYPARDDAPALTADAAGWTWVARVRPRTYQWTRWAGDNRRPEGGWLPEALHDLQPLGPPCGADVTWQVARPPAGPGYFLVGDAACVLDPASSHGVLKALMSGMMAGHLITAVLRRRCPAVVAAQRYGDWLGTWFERDVQRLNELYAQLPTPPAWR